MNIMRIGRNVTIIAFLLSLLFHASTIIYIFMQKKAHSFANTIEQKEEELKNLQKKDGWVETKARASNFGAPVFFQDEPSFAKASSSAEATAGTSAKTTADTPQEDQEQTLEQSAAVSQQDSSDIDDGRSSQEEDFQVPIAQDMTDKNALSLQQLTQKSDPSHSVRKRVPGKKRTRTKKSAQQTSATTTSAGPKPPLSLAQLTQGFMNHIKDEGKYSVSMLGRKSGTPSAEQLKYERYLEKLGWCLQNSYNINNDRCPPITQDTTVHVFLALNRDGSVKDLGLAKSSGNIHLDQFTLFVFRDAGTSFPPVPQHLPNDPFAITYVISVAATNDKNLRFYTR